MITEIINRQFKLTECTKKLPEKTIKAIQTAVKYESGMNLDKHEIETLWKNYYNNWRMKQ